MNCEFYLNKLQLSIQDLKRTQNPISCKNEPGPDCESKISNKGAAPGLVVDVWGKRKKYQSATGPWKGMRNCLFCLVLLFIFHLQNRDIYLKRVLINNHSFDLLYLVQLQRGCEWFCTDMLNIHGKQAYSNSRKAQSSKRKLQFTTRFPIWPWLHCATH